MKIIAILTLITTSSFSYASDRMHLYNKGLSKASSDVSTKKLEGKTFYKCFRNDNYNGSNFYMYPKHIGFLSQNGNRPGISFLNDDGTVKFLDYSKIKRNSHNKRVSYYKLGEHSYKVELLLSGKWRVEQSRLGTPLVTLNDVPFDSAQTKHSLELGTKKMVNFHKSKMKTDENAKMSFSEQVACSNLSKKTNSKSFVTAFTDLKEFQRSRSHNIKREIASKATRYVPIDSGKEGGSSSGTDRTGGTGQGK